MFSLLKCNYRKMNVWIPNQLYECINGHPQVTAFAMMEIDEVFLKFSALQHMLMIPVINGCSKYHVLTIYAADTNTMVMQETDRE